MTSGPILVVDDDHDRLRAFEDRLRGSAPLFAINVEQARRFINTVHRFEVMFLDHDLGDFGPPDCYGYRDEYTGQHVALAVTKLPEHRRPSEVVIHSHNPEGAARMKAILEGAGISAVLSPFEFAAGEIWIRK